MILPHDCRMSDNGPPNEALNLVRVLQSAITGHPPGMAVWAMTSVLIELIATTARDPEQKVKQLAESLPRWLKEGATEMKLPPEN